MFLIITDGILFHKGILRINQIDREDIQYATILITLAVFLSFWWGFVYLANAFEHACNLTRNQSKGTDGLKMGANTGDYKQGEKSIPYIAIFICVCVYVPFFDVFFKRLSRLSMKGHVPVVPHSHDLVNQFLMERSSGTNFGKNHAKRSLPHQK